MWWASSRSQIVPFAGGAGAIVSLTVPDEVPGEQVAAVRERLPEHRAEVPLADREVLDQRVRERQVVLVPERIATGSLALTKPSLRPLSQDSWLAFQLWLGSPTSWHGELSCDRDDRVAVGVEVEVHRRSAPEARSPSTDRRPGTWWGTIPSRLSNEWFSIISTTMCSISGMLGVPAGLPGNGRLSGWRRPAGSATGRAQAGSPRVASNAARRRRRPAASGG